MQIQTSGPGAPGTPSVHRRAAPAEHKDPRTTAATTESSVQRMPLSTERWISEALAGSVTHGERAFSDAPSHEGPGDQTRAFTFFGPFSRYVVNDLDREDHPRRSSREKFVRDPRTETSGDTSEAAGPASPTTSCSKEAGVCENDGIEQDRLHPPQVTLFRQVLDYLRAKPYPPTDCVTIEVEAAATAAVALRWGSYFAVLADRCKPLWPQARSPGASRISDLGDGAHQHRGVRRAWPNGSTCCAERAAHLRAARGEGRCVLADAEEEGETRRASPSPGLSRCRASRRGWCRRRLRRPLHERARRRSAIQSRVFANALVEQRRGATDRSSTFTRAFHGGHLFDCRRLRVSEERSIVGVAIDSGLQSAWTFAPRTRARAACTRVGRTGSPVRARKDKMLIYACGMDAHGIDARGPAFRYLDGASRTVSCVGTGRTRQAARRSIVEHARDRRRKRTPAPRGSCGLRRRAALATARRVRAAGAKLASARDRGPLALDSDETHAVRVEPEAERHEPIHSPRARLAARAARVRARIMPCSYCAAPSITVRMNASAGESPFPSPLALTTRAPALAAARSTSATSTTFRAIRSRLATTSTPARCWRRAASAARRAERSATRETLHTP